MPAELGNIGKRLRCARIFGAGLSLRDAARFLEMPNSRLRDIEMGREEPVVWVAERMFRVYGYFEGMREDTYLTPERAQSLWDEYIARQRRDNFRRGNNPRVA